jgi:hypothetical protein
MNFKSPHIWVAIALYGCVEAFFWSQSGAPIRVKIADAIPLTFGFLAPAILVRGYNDLAKWRWVFMASILLTLVVYDLLSAAMISKREPFDGWYIIYPLGGLFLAGLLVVHLFVVKVLRRSLRHGVAQQTHAASRDR